MDLIGVQNIAFIVLKKDTDSVNVTPSYPLTGEHMNNIRNILSGFSNLFTGFQPRSYAHSNGFKEDAENLGKDVKILGRDFTKSANTVYGKATSDEKKKR